MAIQAPMEISKLLDQFNNDPHSLRTQQLEYLVKQGKIKKQQMIEALHWEAGVDMDGVDEDGNIIGTTMVYGYTHQDFDVNFKYEDYLFFEVPFILTIKDDKFKYQWLTSDLTPEAKKIWQFVSPDIEQNQDQNIKENFSEIIDEALETQEQNKQTK